MFYFKLNSFYTNCPKIAKNQNTLYYKKIKRDKIS